MINKKTLYKLNKMADTYNLGEVENIEKLYSSQNNVYKLITNKSIYTIKEFSYDAIKNNYYLRKRKEQIRVSKVLNEIGIETSIPIPFNNKKLYIFSPKLLFNI